MQIRDTESRLQVADGDDGKTSDQEKSKSGCVASQEENKFIPAPDDDDLKISFW